MFTAYGSNPVTFPLEVNPVKSLAALLQGSDIWTTAAAK